MVRADGWPSKRRAEKVPLDSEMCSPLVTLTVAVLLEWWAYKAEGRAVKTEGKERNENVQTPLSGNCFKENALEQQSG